MDWLLARSSGITKAVVFLASAVLIAGCGGGMSSGPVHPLPDVRNLVITLPAGWSSAGGTVTIACQVTCDEGVKEVKAYVVKPEGTEDSLTMTLTSGDAFSGTYSGSYTAPANTGATGWPERYGVGVLATSTLNAVGGLSRPRAFSVPAP